MTNNSIYTLDIDNSIYTLDVDTGEMKAMDRPKDGAPDFGVPYGICGDSLFVWELGSSAHIRLLRKGKDLGPVLERSPQLLITDIPGGFVSGFKSKLLVRDDDGNVVQELLKDQKIHEVRRANDLLTAVSSKNGGTIISAWQIANPVCDERKDEDVMI
jgi:hypothetical protein